MSKGTLNLSGGMEACEECMSFPTLVEQLLPGIRNEITLNHVIPQLPGNSFRNLPSINRAWLYAFRSAEIFYARLRSHSTKKFIVLTFDGPFFDEIVLYSRRGNFCCDLPPIPNLRERVPVSCQSVTLDGKIYIMGGRDLHYSVSYNDRVYVLDLAGQRHWKQCASMKERKRNFGCGVINGKIYVIGGTSSSRAAESEVYDPKGDGWSPIKQMQYPRVSCSVEAVGEELFVFGGSLLGRNLIDQLNNIRITDLDDESNDDTEVVEVYHPAKDEWRIMKLFGKQSNKILFMVRGKFYSVTRFGTQTHRSLPGLQWDIRIYDADKKSWIFLHSVLVDNPAVSFQVFAVKAADDELLLKCNWSKWKTGRRRLFAFQRCGLVQSRGLGDKSKETVWNRVPLPRTFRDLHMNSDRISTIQL